MVESMPLIGEVLNSYPAEPSAGLFLSSFPLSSVILKCRDAVCRFFYYNGYIVVRLDAKHGKVHRMS